MLQHIVECVPSVPFVPGALSFFSSRFLPRPKVILSCHRGVTSWCIYILHISSNLINVCVSVSLSWSELSTGIQTPSIDEAKVAQCSLFFSFYVPMFSSHFLVSWCRSWAQYERQLCSLQKSTSEANMIINHIFTITIYIYYIIKSKLIMLLTKYYWGIVLG